MAVAVDGDAVRLTRREFELLRYLVQNKNRVVSRDRLLERVWGYDRLVETRSVDVHVGRLRGKLRHAGRRSKPWSAWATASLTSRLNRPAALEQFRHLTLDAQQAAPHAVPVFVGFARADCAIFLYALPSRAAPASPTV